MPTIEDYSEYERQAIKNAENGNWDLAISYAKKTPANWSTWDILASMEIPPEHIEKVIDSVPKEAKPGFIFELASNLHPDILPKTLEKIAEHAKEDEYSLPIILEHPNWKPSQDLQNRQLASNFWSSYESRVHPSHFAAIKSLYSGKPESIKTHRGDKGYSDQSYVEDGLLYGPNDINLSIDNTEDIKKKPPKPSLFHISHALPHLKDHAQAVQNEIMNDKNIPKRYLRGKPYILLHRGVGGSYTQKIKNKINYNPKTNEAESKHITLPTASFSSWTTDPGMAKRFASTRGDHEGITGQGMIISAWHPVESILHSGFHTVVPGQDHPHRGESEIIIGHPKEKMKIHSKNLSFQDEKQEYSFNKPKLNKSDILEKSNVIQFKKKLFSQKKEEFQPLSDSFLTSKEPLTVGQLEELNRHANYSDAIIDMAHPDHDADVIEWHSDYLNKIINRIENSLKSTKNPKLIKGLKGDWEKEDYTFQTKKGKKIHEITAHDKNGNQIGWLGLNDRKSHLDPININIDPEHRRKGLASQMYQLAEQTFGKKIKPSEIQTEEGKALWSQPGRKFGLKKGMKGDWEKEGYNFKYNINPSTLEPERTQISISAFDINGNKSGEYIFSYNPDFEMITPDDVYTDPEHRRKGLATHAYKLAEKISNRYVDPSGGYQSEDAEKLWAQPRRSFGKSLQKAYKINDRWLPHKSDAGKSHPEDKDLVGHIDKTGSAVWSHNDNLNLYHVNKIRNNFNKLKLSENGMKSLSKLIGHVYHDPDKGVMSAGTTPGASEYFNELRIRHLGNAISGKPGYSIYETPEGHIEIKSELRHSKNPKNPWKSTTWNWDGKKLKSIKINPITNEELVGEHIYEK